MTQDEDTKLIKKSIGQNAILNVFTTLLRVIFPLITFPYVSRVLQVENLGKVNYATSIISYYALFAALGISTYAVREGARNRDNRIQTERFASQVFSINIVSTVVAYIALALSLVFVNKFHDYTVLLIIESATILFTTLGVDWVNIIYEDYTYIALRSFTVQIFSLVALFIFVHRTTDYYIYAIITVANQGIISVLNIFHVRKYCRVRFTFKMDIRKHIRPIMVLFSNNLAVSIYVNSDMTMLGWMIGDYYVGLYSVAVKIYTIIKQLLAALYNVMIARLSYYYAQEQLEKFKSLLNNAINAIIFLTVPATCGLICISREVILVISGKSYIEATTCLQILSIALFFAMLGGVFSNCVNLPLKRERINLIATSISAAVNIGLNIFLIPIFHHNAAAFTTLISEFLVFAILFFCTKDHYDYFNKHDIFLNLIKSFISAIPIISIAFVFHHLVEINDVLYLFIEIIFGGGAYFMINVLLKNQWVYKVKDNITAKIRRN